MQFLQRFVQVNDLWRKVTILFKHLNTCPGKKKQMNLNFLNNLTTYTHTHIHFKVTLELTFPSPPGTTTTPFPARRRVLRPIPMVPFRHQRLTRVNSPYSSLPGISSLTQVGLDSSKENQRQGCLAHSSLCTAGRQDLHSVRHKVGTKPDMLNVKKKYIRIEGEIYKIPQCNWQVFKLLNIPEEEYIAYRHSVSKSLSVPFK